MFDGVSDETIEFMESKGQVWDVIPGVGMLEIELSRIKALYNILEEASKIEGKRISIVLDRLEDDKDNTEPMMYGTMTTNITPMTC